LKLRALCFESGNTIFRTHCRGVWLEASVWRQVKLRTAPRFSLTRPSIRA
jgi:hypothetical protein